MYSDRCACRVQILRKRIHMIHARRSLQDAFKHRLRKLRGESDAAGSGKSLRAHLALRSFAYVSHPIQFAHGLLSSLWLFS